LPPNPRHALIRRAYQAFASRDADRLKDLASPDIEICTVTGELVERSEPYCGEAGLETYLADVANVWDELELTPAEFHDLDSERVLVLGRVLARRGTTLVDSPNAWLWTIRDERIARAEVFSDPESASALLRPTGDGGD
jgi:ketosteroid isomerase-like protein